MRCDPETMLIVLEKSEHGFRIIVHPGFHLFFSIVRGKGFPNTNKFVLMFEKKSEHARYTLPGCWVPPYFRFLCAQISNLGKCSFLAGKWVYTWNHKILERS